MPGAGLASKGLFAGVPEALCVFMFTLGSVPGAEGGASTRGCSVEAQMGTEARQSGSGFERSRAGGTSRLLLPRWPL